MATTAEAIVQQMLRKDAFSRWMGMSIEEVAPNYCRVKMEVRNEMVNGFLIAHGGITYSLADSALAFACNAAGKQAVSVDTSIKHLQSVKSSDTLIAVAKLLKRSNAMGWYEVKVTNQNRDLVADFSGTVYITKKDWNIDGENE